jgi:4-amino-4-deoxy-L-arabinose transferase-like glycosyltransferase
VLTRPSRPAPWRSVGAGFALATATLARITPAAVLGPVLLFGALTPRRQRRWGSLVLGLGIAGLLVGGALLNNSVRSGDARLSIGTGKHLYNHFVHAQGLVDEQAPYTLALRRAIGNPHLPDMAHWDVSEAMRGRPLDAPPGDIFLGVALEAARTASILDHLWFDSKLTVAHLFADPVPHMVTDRMTTHDDRGLSADAILPAWRSAPSLRDSMASVHPYLWPAFAGLFLLGFAALALAEREERRLWWVCMWIPLSYLFTSSAVEYYQPRYNAAIAPFVVIVAFASVGAIFERLRGHAGTSAARADAGEPSDSPSERIAPGLCP